MSHNVQPPAPPSSVEAPAPAPARKGNIGLGIVAAVVAGLIAAAAYGGIMYALDRERPFGSIFIGALVGFAAKKIGGRNAVMPAVAGLVSIGAVYLGKMFLFALALADLKKISLSDVIEAIGVGGLNDIVKESLDLMSLVFIGISVVVAVGTVLKTDD
ncbi:hypothetical protein ABZ716_10520 [Streptomyces sp. NPDC006687]|uniref:hypothetical protein n=1 Tax=unclassified Streptomyces TaxID=2593676 RepID=UPI0033E95186